MSDRLRYPVVAHCESCGRVFYTATSAGKLCDVTTCRGYLVHVARTSSPRRDS